MFTWAYFTIFNRIVILLNIIILKWHFCVVKPILCTLFFIVLQIPMIVLIIVFNTFLIMLSKQFNIRFNSLIYLLTIRIIHIQVILIVLSNNTAAISIHNTNSILINISKTVHTFNITIFFDIIRMSQHYRLNYRRLFLLKND